MRGGYDPKAILHELRYRRRRNRPQGQPPLAGEPAPLVSVVCVTNRPGQAEHVLASFRAQRWAHKELIIIANTTGYPSEFLADAADASVETVDQSRSLGACLNIGFEMARGVIIVRFDDDDHYAPSYLDDVVDVFATTDAQVTGRTEYFAYVESLDKTVRRFPGRAEQFVGRVAGGTIAVVADRVSTISFPDISLGEDTEFVRRCERAGLRVWAAPPEGFLQTRRPSGHTWEVDDATFVADAATVGEGNQPDYWMGTPKH